MRCNIRGVAVVLHPILFISMGVINMQYCVVIQLAETSAYTVFGPYDALNMAQRDKDAIVSAVKPYAYSVQLVHPGHTVSSWLQGVDDHRSKWATSGDYPVT